MQTIKAAVCHAFGAPLQIENIQIRSPDVGEVEVDLDAVAICHSDISFADGAWGGSLPAVYGHEAAGRVRSVGPNVTSVAAGDVAELDSMSQELHEDEATRDQAITYLQQREAEMTNQLSQTEAELRAAMDGLREARREAEELRSYVEQQGAG